MELSTFQIREGDEAGLDSRPTRVEDFYASDEDYQRQLREGVEEMAALQQRLYASGKHALLIILQAMDAAGKDGIIRHVFTGLNPQGCQVHSFKQPCGEELQHDFLWRTTLRLPPRGMIGIFNRSYYEEVLVVRVHPEYLQAQGIDPADATDGAFWKKRFRSINEHEAHLHRNGTRILKFYLHLSPEEQRERFLKRLDDPAKNWKFNEGDLKERALWPQYRKAYEEAISATSTKHAAWFVVPADDKKNARLIVCAAILDAMRGMGLAFPEVGWNCSCCERGWRPKRSAVGPIFGGANNLACGFGVQWRPHVWNQGGFRISGYMASH